MIRNTSHPTLDNPRERYAWPVGLFLGYIKVNCVLSASNTHGLSIDTTELYERNMIDELAPRLVHGSYR